MTIEIEIGEKGQRFRGEIESDLSVLRGWSWPYTVIRGGEDGPRTTITAGIHGCEYVSIYAAMRLAQELDPDEVRGDVVVVPIVNLPSYWERSAFVGPYDGKNLNRLFPGKSTGTFSEALAYFTFNTFILPSDAFMDLHGGDLVEDLEPFTALVTGGDAEVEAQSRAMAEAFGLPYIVSRIDGASAPSGMTYTSAARRGIASVLAEAGGCGQLTMPDVDLLVDGVRRALIVTGNLSGDPTPPSKPQYIERSEAFATEHDGFWIPAVRAGEMVEEGQQLGQILSLTSEVIATFVAPRDGVIIFRTTSSAVKKGGLLLNIGSW
jgi:uncharacterized protein